MVDGVIGLDEDAGWVYFNSTRGSALERRVERVSLAGGAIETLSEPGGLHGASLSKDGKWLAMLSSSLGSPPSISLVATDGSARRTLYQSEVSAGGLGLAPPELRTFTAADGTTLYGALYRPEGDGPSPLLVAVYGGPHAQTVLDAWGLTVDLRAQYLAQQGFLVVKLDNRGMAGTRPGVSRLTCIDRWARSRWTTRRRPWSNWSQRDWWMRSGSASTAGRTGAT